MAQSIRWAMLAHLLVALSVAGASAALVPAAAAQAPEAKAATPDSPTLVFEDEHPLKVGWVRLQQNLAVEVCNTGSKEGTLHARLVDFDFEVDDRPAHTGDVVVLDPAEELTVDAGTCEPLSLRVGSQSPDAGDYSGVIVLRSPTALVRRDLTISAPKRNQTRAETLVEEVGLRAERDGMWDDLVIGPTSSLPLRESERLIVPAPGATIGILQSGNHRLRVIVDGKPTPGRSPRYLPVRLEGSDEVGTYAGTVDLAVGEALATPVKIKVEASDRLWVPLALIGVGLGLALLWLLYLERWRPEGQLHDRHRRLSNLYEDAKVAFDRNYGDQRFHAYRPCYENVKRYESTLDISIRRYAKDNVLFKRDSEEFKQILRSLQDAEADAASFGDEAGFGKTLEKLDTTVSEFHDDYPDSAPVFIERAAARLKGVPLSVGGATKVAAEADAYLTFAADWKDMAREVKRLEAWVEVLEAMDLQPAEAETLATAKAKVNEAKLELCDAENAASLDAVGAKRDLRRAYALLAVLGSKYVWIPSDAIVIVRNLEGIVTQSYFAGPESLNYFAVPESLDDLIARARGSDIGGFVAAAISRTVRGAADAAVLAVAVATALLAGLPTVVADDTFGSWRDYLLALGLGGTSAVAAKGLVDVVSQMRRRERTSPASSAAPTT